MEKLVIDNFLAIEHAEIEIKKINLFIGPQAQGKSLISKLIYFFKEYPRTMIEAVEQGSFVKEEFDQFVLDKFIKIFPKYTWEDRSFRVAYECDHYSVSITNSPVDNENGSKSKLIFALQGYDVFLAAFEKFVAEYKSFDDAFSYYNFTQGGIDCESIMMEWLDTDYLETCLYVPAGRSFFATVEKNIFSFLSSEITIDYFLVLFGKYYSNTKEAIKRGFYDNLDIKDEQRIRIEKLVKQIICGDYLFENKQSWIISDKGKTNIVDASSGQQEALPIALLLSKLPYFTIHHFIIEEPETHLFPVSQNEIVLLIANAYNYLRSHEQSSSGSNSFTIETHSPYILTAFNNLIQARNVAASKNYEDLDALRNIVPESEWVDFNDVTAYVVNNGTVKSILNQELKLIDANMIDDVSEHLAYIFEKLTFMEDIDE